MIRLRKKRKRGSPRCKHRRHVSRWLQCVLANMRPKKTKGTAMYPSVEECLRAERKK